MNKMILELGSRKVDVRVDGTDGVLGTLVINQDGLGFKNPHQRGACEKILPWEKVGALVDAAGDKIIGTGACGAGVNPNPPQVDRGNQVS